MADPIFTLAGLSQPQGSTPISNSVFTAQGIPAADAGSFGSIGAASSLPTFATQGGGNPTAVDPNAGVNTVTVPASGVAPSSSGGDLLNSAGGTDSSSPSSSGSVPSITFLDNVANDFHQFAYHIQFYALPEGATSTSSGMIIIAESGVTGFNISSLVIESTAAPSSTSSVSFATNFKMVVTEPMGTSFLDAIQSAAKQCGISNWAKSSYYIAISFKAYDENGDPHTNPCSSWPNGGVWTYGVFLTTSDFHVNSAGGTYNLNFTHMADTGITNTAAARTQQVTTPIGNTLGEFMTSFSKQLNDAPANKGLFNYSIAYQKGQLPNPSGFKFSQSPTTDVASMRGFKVADKAKSGANLPPGSLIVDAILSAIGATVEGQKYIVSSSGSLQPGATSAGGKYRDAGLYRVIPTVSLGAFNSKTNNYAKNIVFNIKGAKIQNTTLDGSETNGTNGPSALNAINAYGGLKKRYMHHFTGLNTEVLEFDTKFNFAGLMALPSANGANYYTDNVRQGAAYREVPGAAAASPSAAQPAASAISNLASSALNAGGSFGSLASAGGNLINSLTGGPATGAGSGVAASGGFGGVLSAATSLIPQVANLVRNGVTTATPTTGGASSAFGGSIYVEDSMVQDSATQLKVSTIQTYNSARQDAGSGTPTQGNAGKSVFGAMLSQIGGTNSNFLMGLDNFKIKGDPYWLGMDHNTMVSNTDTSGGLPDHSQGTISVLIHMQFPYNWEETGTTTFRPSEVFTGIYDITRIVNNFTNGVFTQVLKGTRNMTITNDDAVALLAKSTLQSSSSGVGGGGSSGNGGLLSGAIGGFASGLGSLLSGAAGTSMPTSQSSNNITPAAAAAPVTTTSSGIPSAAGAPDFTGAVNATNTPGLINYGGLPVSDF